MPIKWLRKTGYQHTLLSSSNLLFYISSDYFNNAAFASNGAKLALALVQKSPKLYLPILVEHGQLSCQKFQICYV